MTRFRFDYGIAVLAGSPTSQMTRLLAALRGNQHDTGQFIGVIAGTVPIPEFFAPGNIQRIIDSSRSGRSLPVARRRR